MIRDWMKGWINLILHLRMIQATVFHRITVREDFVGITYAVLNQPVGLQCEDLWTTKQNKRVSIVPNPLCSLSSKTVIFNISTEKKLDARSRFEMKNKHATQRNPVGCCTFMLVQISFNNNIRSTFPLSSAALWVKQSKKKANHRFCVQIRKPVAENPLHFSHTWFGKNIFRQPSSHPRPESTDCFPSL